MSTGIINDQMRQAGLFLRTLFAPYSSGYVEVRMLLKTGGQNARKQVFVPLPFTADSLRAICAQAIKHSDGGWDVYVGVLPRSEAKGAAEYVREGAWFWADLDHKNLDQQRIDEAIVGADMVVSSGHGTHAYWFLGRVRPLTTQIERDLFTAMLREVQEGVSDGLADNVADLPRILRLPGTGNHKSESDPVPVTLDKYPSLAPQKAHTEPKHSPVASDAPKPAEGPVGLAGESTPVLIPTPEDDARVQRLLVQAWEAMEAGTLPPGPFWLAAGSFAPEPGVWLRKARERRARLFKLRGTAWWEVGEGQRLAQDLEAFAYWFANADLVPLLEDE